MMQVVELNKCKFEHGILSLESDHVQNQRFPTELGINSHHTGRTVVFRPIGMSHPMYNEDQWDGEQAVYEPITSLKNVKVLVVYHSH